MATETVLMAATSASGDCQYLLKAVRKRSLAVGAPNEVEGLYGFLLKRISNE